MECQDGRHTNHSILNTASVAGTKIIINQIPSTALQQPRVRFPDFCKIVFQDNTWIIIYYDPSIKLVISFKALRFTKANFMGS